MTQLTFEDLATAKLSQLISRKESFEVVGLGGKLMESIRLVENKIESTGMTCRVYTVGRVGLIAGSFAGGITGALGLLSATGIALHNLVTINPDYEIEKYPTYNRIVVRYKKKK
ncbi:hypothetical protein [Pseudomonas sp. Gutcm_11s]|uniref:hypothetical protein n=1 Tax=Pseudomonas sp. Gutcm_11s TaxID=3026088 RepID=UPI00235FE6DC|nr:hypothetical protein [Pseudomonas sp. Gutcm_11s]MDD0841166.1 hypothetical protein [Pseudomonas sp. Gutcm_11s]